MYHHMWSQAKGGGVFTVSCLIYAAKVSYCEDKKKKKKIEQPYELCMLTLLLFAYLFHVGDVCLFVCLSVSQGRSVGGQSLCVYHHLLTPKSFTKTTTDSLRVKVHESASRVPFRSSTDDKGWWYFRVSACRCHTVPSLFSSLLFTAKTSSRRILSIAALVFAPLLVPLSCRLTSILSSLRGLPGLILVEESGKSPPPHLFFFFLVTGWITVSSNLFRRQRKEVGCVTN